MFIALWIGLSKSRLQAWLDPEAHNEIRVLSTPPMQIALLLVACRLILSCYRHSLPWGKDGHYQAYIYNLRKFLSLPSFIYTVSKKTSDWLSLSHMPISRSSHCGQGDTFLSCLVRWSRPEWWLEFSISRWMERKYLCRKCWGYQMDVAD